MTARSALFVTRLSCMLCLLECVWLQGTEYRSTIALAMKKCNYLTSQRDGGSHQVYCRVDTSSRTQVHSVSPPYRPQCAAFRTLGFFLMVTKWLQTPVTHAGISHRNKKVQKRKPLYPKRLSFMSHYPEEVHTPNPRPVTGNKKWKVYDWCRRNIVPSPNMEKGPTFPGNNLCQDKPGGPLARRKRAMVVG